MLEADKKPEAPKITEVLTIAIEEGTGKVMVKGALGNKKLCFNVIGETIKIVANFEESKIIKPGVRFQRPGGIMSFVRGKRK